MWHVYWTFDCCQIRVVVGVVVVVVGVVVVVLVVVVVGMLGKVEPKANSLCRGVGHSKQVLQSWHHTTINVQSTRYGGGVYGCVVWCIVCFYVLCVFMYCSTWV